MRYVGHFLPKKKQTGCWSLVLLDETNNHLLQVSNPLFGIDAQKLNNLINFLYKVILFYLIIITLVTIQQMHLP